MVVVGYFAVTVLLEYLNTLCNFERFNFKQTKSCSDFQSVVSKVFASMPLIMMIGASRS